MRIYRTEGAYQPPSNNHKTSIKRNFLSNTVMMESSTRIARYVYTYCNRTTIFRLKFSSQTNLFRSAISIWWYSLAGRNNNNEKYIYSLSNWKRLGLLHAPIERGAKYHENEEKDLRNTRLNLSNSVAPFPALTLGRIKSANVNISCLGLVCPGSYFRVGPLEFFIAPYLFCLGRIML
jgi:hypothetical protein